MAVFTIGKLNKEKAVGLHRELWNKVAEIIHRDGISPGDIALSIKYKALKELRFNEMDQPIHGCWLCEYKKQKSISCYDCPIKWNKMYCDDSGSEYNEFIKAVRTHNEHYAYKVALIIANLPERN